MEYFISDCHFGHKNILEYDKRPFDDVKNMDEAMEKLWNETVTEEDDVYILGDFIWTKYRNCAKKYVSRLKGHKHLILGNHDQVFEKNREYFISEGLIDDMEYYKELKIGNDVVVLSHYPMPFWKSQFWGWYHFYGHVHSSPQWTMCENLRTNCEIGYNAPFKMINVGCMMPYVNYIPRTFSEIKEAVEERCTIKEDD